MKKILNLESLFAGVVLMIFISSCSNKNATAKDAEVVSKAEKMLEEKEFSATLSKHLDAVSNKDLLSLKSTMSPEGKMQLILPGTEIINSVDGFMEYHKEWFQDTSWTFETKVLNTAIGDQIGIAITEIVYRDPERNGKPYFNRMIVSYGLEKLNGKWYIIKDHASSIEKTKN